MDTRCGLSRFIDFSEVALKDMFSFYHLQSYMTIIQPDFLSSSQIYLSSVERLLAWVGCSDSMPVAPSTTQTRD